MRDMLAGDRRQHLLRLVAESDHARADERQPAGEEGHLGRIARRQHQYVQSHPSSTLTVEIVRSQSLFHDRGLGMAEEDVALALVTRRLRLADLGQLRLHDQMPEVALDRRQSVHRLDAALALAAQVGATGSEAVRRRIELVLDHEPRPGAIEVEVVGVGDQRRDLRPRRPRADLGDQRGTVRFAEPLHVRQAGAHSEHLESAKGDAPDVVETRMVDLARNQHAPLDPRVIDDVERRRQVVRKRVPDRPAADRDGVERELVPDHELLDDGLALRGGADRGERRPHLAGVADPEGALGASTGGRLEHHGVADVLDERPGFGVARHPLMPRAGHAGALQNGLHPRLVAEVLRHLGAHAFDPERVAHLAQRDLQLLEGADQALRRADQPRQAAHRVGDLLWIESVGDPEVRRELPLRPGGSLSAGSWLMRPVRTPGRSATASTKRSVVSRKKGATKTTDDISLLIFLRSEEPHILAELVGHGQGDGKIGVAENHETVGNQGLLPVAARRADRQEVLPDDRRRCAAP